jgi:excisionase family DNA binding protein
VTATVYGEQVAARGDRLTVREVAALLDVTPETVRVLIRDGKLAAELDARTYWVRPADIDAYQASRPTTPPDPAAMAAELGGLTDEIATVQARERELLEARGRALVHYVDEEGHSVTKAAKAAKLSRDRTTTILREARGRLAEERAKRQR